MTECCCVDGTLLEPTIVGLSHGSVDPDVSQLYISIDLISQVA